MIERNDLLNVLKSIQPGVVSREITSSLGCFCFRDGLVLSYNGIIGMWMAFDIGFDGLVPAATLLGFLEASRVKEIEFELAGDAELKAKAGRSKLTVPLRSVDDFAFQPGKLAADPIFKEPADMHLFIEALKKASISLGVDLDQPARLGVTCALCSHEGSLYSSDNATLTEAACDAKLQGGANKTLTFTVPNSFCAMLIRINVKDKCKVLYLSENALLAEFDSGLWIFTHTPVEPNPDQFTRVFDRCLDGNERSTEFPIPTRLALVLRRARCLIDKPSFDLFTKLDIKDQTMRITTTTAAGEVVDSLKLQFSCGEIVVKCSAALLERALPYADTMMVLDKCIAFGGPSFSHLVSVVAVVKE